MSTKSLSRQTDLFPSFYDDFFKPWSEWIGNGTSMFQTNKVPSVNVSESSSEYKLTLAAPGMKKEDFHIDIEGSMLTVSSEKEESKEEKDTRFTRKEYSYSSFSRSFTLPSEVNQEKIDASYVDGILSISLPKKEDSKKQSLARSIKVK